MENLPNLLFWVKGMSEPKIATLKKLTLHVHGDGGPIDIQLKDIEVVKDQAQRHIVYLQNHAVRVVLMRDGSKVIRAYSETHGIFGVVPIDPKTQKPNLPDFIQRLLA